MVNQIIWIQAARQTAVHLPEPGIAGIDNGCEFESPTLMDHNQVGSGITQSQSKSGCKYLSIFYGQFTAVSGTLFQIYQ